MTNNIDCIILAAGLSSRMKSFKPLMLYNGFTFIETIINKVIKHVNKVIIVTGYNSEKIEHLLNLKYKDKNVFTVFNPNYNDSMFLSLHKGIELLELNHFALYHFVDQPTIPEEFYPFFLSQIDEKSAIIQPKFNNKKGHPLLFSFNFCKHLLNSDINSNLKTEMEKFENKKKYWNCEYEQILKDFDTMEEYKTIKDN